MVGSAEYDMNSERPIPPHKIFGDNLGLGCGNNKAGVQQLGHCNKYYSGLREEKGRKGVFETLVYLGKKIC